MDEGPGCAGVECRGSGSGLGQVGGGDVIGWMTYAACLRGIVPGTIECTAFQDVVRCGVRRCWTLPLVRRRQGRTGQVGCSGGTVVG